MTFTDQWANQHDAACELGARPGYQASSVIACHCYRRWLEGRLGEISAVLRHITEQCVYHSNALLSPKDAE